MPRNGGGGNNNGGQQRNGGNNGRTMNGGANDANDEPPFSEQVMRRLAPNDEPIPDELLKMDRDIVERVVSEILEAPAAIQWKDIAGLRHAKAAVQELAVWPLMKPELFRGARSVPLANHSVPSTRCPAQPSGESSKAVSVPSMCPRSSQRPGHSRCCSTRP